MFSVNPKYTNAAENLQNATCITQWLNKTIATDHVDLITGTYQQVQGMIVTNLTPDVLATKSKGLTVIFCRYT